MVQGDNQTWNNHIELASWCQLLLIPPMTANTLANLANGQCTELLHAVYLSAKSDVMACPAMDHDMWHHNSVKRNLSTLIQDGVHIMMPEHGPLASGLVGDGRLPEPSQIVAAINLRFGTRLA
jgi:phosphopantothenoylcysteine decarboxylase/phosphopantothenate--cysteine ligase